MSLLTGSDVPNIILPVTFIAVFIGIMFFTYATTIERKIVKKQINYLTSDLASYLDVISNPALKEEIKKALQNVKMPNLTASDEATQKHNDEIKTMATKTLLIVAVVGFVATFFSARANGLDFVRILINNMIVLSFIAIVEFSFLTFITTKFISVDVNQFKKTVLLALTKNPPSKKALDSAPTVSAVSDFLEKTATNKAQQEISTIPTVNPPTTTIPTLTAPELPASKPNLTSFTASVPTGLPGGIPTPSTPSEAEIYSMTSLRP